MITLVPAVNPLTTPVDALTLATVVFELVHTPPVIVFAKVVFALIHTEVVPVIAAVGATNTVALPVVFPATQFDEVPDDAKFLIAPVKLFPLTSVKVVIDVLFAFTKPWLNL